MKWDVESLLRNFRKKTKSKSRERKDEKTKEKRDIQRDRRKSIIRSWNRRFHEIKCEISFFSFREKTKRHEHRHRQRDTETINNDRHSINKIIFFDRWYRWVHRRIKQMKTTNFKTSQRNFHEIVETLKIFIFWEKFSFSRQKRQRQQRQKKQRQQRQKKQRQQRQKRSWFSF